MTLVLATATLAQAQVKPARFDAVVVGVAAGDRLVVRAGGIQEEVDLYGVACPGLWQAHGKDAFDLTSAAIMGRTVNVIIRGPGLRKRRSADVVLPDGKLLNHELLRAGLAWWFWRESADDQRSADLHDEARAAGRGLWADPQVLPPWEMKPPGGKQPPQKPKGTPATTTFASLK